MGRKELIKFCNTPIKQSNTIHDLNLAEHPLEVVSVDSSAVLTVGLLFVSQNLY